MAATQEAQGFEGNGSRHRRRRDRGGQSGNWWLEHSHQPVNQRGNRYTAGAKVNSTAKVDSIGGRYGAPCDHNGYGGGHHDDGWSRNWYGGVADYHRVPAPPPWADQPEETSLKDLLAQVAPQARIAETSSKLSSKASANILSKVLSEATQSSAQEQWAASAGSSTDPSGGYGSHNRKYPKHEEDDEEAFAARWSGLFSQGSPLVNGTLEDPFSDLKKRAKVVWKKNSERSGHRQRYQERKMKKHQENGDDVGAEVDEGGASVVYDYSQTQWQPQRAADANGSQTQWQPQRPPENQRQPQRPPDDREDSDAPLY